MFNIFKKTDSNVKPVDRLSNASKRAEQSDKESHIAPSAKSGGSFSKALNAVRSETGTQSGENEPIVKSQGDVGVARPSKSVPSFNAAINARREKTVNPFLKITQNRLQAAQTPIDPDHQ